MSYQVINSNGLTYEGGTSCGPYSNLEHVYMWESSGYLETPKMDPLLNALEDSSIAQYLQQLAWMPQHNTELFDRNDWQLR